MIINTNLNALNAHRNMSSSLSKSGKAMEKLSSGFKINRGSDDAAGLSISEKMRAQIKGLTQASNNAQNAIALLQTAEGALTETQSMAHRMRELAVQGATETNTPEDNAVLDKEFQLLKAEMDRSANTTQFNKKTLLDGSLGAIGTTGTSAQTGNGVETIEIISSQLGTITLTSGGTNTTGPYTLTAEWVDATNPANTKTQTINDIDLIGAGTTKTIEFTELGFYITLNENFNETSLDGGANSNIVVTPGEAAFQVGANANQTINFTMRDMRATGDVLKLSDVNVLTIGNSNEAIVELDRVLNEISMERATVGAMANRLEYTCNNLAISTENLTSAESRIRDTDMAKEMMTYARYNILQQASQAMIAQANQQPQGVLQLLR